MQRVVSTQPFMQDSVRILSAYNKVARSSIPCLYAVPRTEGTNPLRMGVMHPEVLLNPHSTPFGSADDFETSKHKEPVRELRQNIMRCKLNIKNYFTEENQFYPVNQRAFSAFPCHMVPGLAQMSVAAASFVSPNHQRRQVPVCIYATQVTLAIQQSAKNETRLDHMLDHFRFQPPGDDMDSDSEMGGKQEPWYSKDDMWVISRPSAKVEKRRCLKSGNEVTLRLSNAISDPHYTLWGGARGQDRPPYWCKLHFEYAKSYDDFLVATKAWSKRGIARRRNSGDAALQYEHIPVPIFMMEINPVTGQRSALRSEEQGGSAIGAGVCALIPDHEMWADRADLNHALMLLNNSEFYPRAEHMQDTLQHGKGRATTLAEWRRDQQLRASSSSTSSTSSSSSSSSSPTRSAEALPKLLLSAREVTFAVHFARQKYNGPRTVLSRRARQRNINKKELGDYCFVDTLQDAIPYFYEELQDWHTSQGDAGGGFVRGTVYSAGAAAARHERPGLCRETVAFSSTGPDFTRQVEEVDGRAV